MLLIVLGEQTSAESAAAASEEDVQKVSREVARITAISAEQAESVLERVSPHDRGRRLRGARRHRFRPQAADAGVRPGHRQAAAGPLDQSAGRRSGFLRRAAKGRPAAARQVHPQRTSADHRAGPVAPQRLPGGGAADLAAGRAALRRGAAHGEPGPDLAGNHPENRRRHRPEAEGPGRIQPRILRRRARRGGGAEPSGFRPPAARSSTTSNRATPTWRRPSATSCSSSKTCC